MRKSFFILSLLLISLYSFSQKYSGETILLKTEDNIFSKTIEKKVYFCLNKDTLLSTIDNNTFHESIEIIDKKVSTNQTIFYIVIEHDTECEIYIKNNRIVKVILYCGDTIFTFC